MLKSKPVDDKSTFLVIQWSYHFHICFDENLSIASLRLTCCFDWVNLMSTRKRSRCHTLNVECKSSRHIPNLTRGHLKMIWPSFASMNRSTFEGTLSPCASQRAMKPTLAGEQLSPVGVVFMKVSGFSLVIILPLPSICRSTKLTHLMSSLTLSCCLITDSHTHLPSFWSSSTRTSMPHYHALTFELPISIANFDPNFSLSGDSQITRLHPNTYPQMAHCQMSFSMWKSQSSPITNANKCIDGLVTLRTSQRYSFVPDCHVAERVRSRMTTTTKIHDPLTKLYPLHWKQAMISLMRLDSNQA